MSCCPLARSFHCTAEASPHLLTGPPLQCSLCLCVCVCVCVWLSLSLCICLCLSRISLQDQGMISFLSEILFQKMSFTFHEMFHCPKSEFGRRRRFNLQCAERDGERHRERERVHRERQRQRESTGETGSLSRKCNLHQKLKVPVVLGWELHASPTKTFFYLWGKGSNIVQKYETQTDRQFKQFQIERNLLQLQ